MKDNIMELRKEIASTHIMLEDLQLYLDTHPSDKNALLKRNAFVKQLRMLKDEYDRNFGMLSQDDSLSDFPWEWIEEPWPWEYDANYKL